MSKAFQTSISGDAATEHPRCEGLTNANKVLTVKGINEAKLHLDRIKNKRNIGRCKRFKMRVRSWLRMNAGGVLNTCKSNEAPKAETSVKAEG